MSTSYQTLVAGLAELGLTAMHDGADAVIDAVNSGSMSFTEGLDRLVSMELRKSRTRRMESITAAAHFPSKKTFEQFDFSFQPDLRKDEILDLQELRFMEDGSNVHRSSGSRKDTSRHSHRHGCRAERQDGVFHRLP